MGLCVSHSTLDEPTGYDATLGGQFGFGGGRHTIGGENGRSGYEPGLHGPIVESPKQSPEVRGEHGEVFERFGVHETSLMGGRKEEKKSRHPAGLGGIV